MITLWTFEGSRELGAVAAISYYLDPKGNHPSSAIPNLSQDGSLPPGWAKG